MSKFINTALICCAFWCIYLLSVAGPFASSDDVVMMQTAYQLANEGHLHIPSSDLPQVINGQNGKLYSKYDPGLPLLTVPVMWWAAWIADHNIGANSFVVGAYFAMLIPTGMMALAMAGLYRLGLRLYSHRRAVYITVVAGLGTTVWPYGHIYFAEGVLTAALVWAVFGLLVDKRASLSMASAALGVGILTRASFAIYWPNLLILAAFWRDLPRPVGATSPAPRRRWLYLSIGPILAIGGLLIHNTLRFGDPFTTGYTDEGFTTPVWEGVIGLLLSPGKSIFIYAPPLILSIWGWRRFYRQYPKFTRGLLLISSIVIVFYGSWWAWHGGWVWGPRFLVPLMPLWCLAIPPITRRNIIIFALIFFAGGGVQYLGTFTDTTPAYTEAFANADPDDETRYAMVHYQPTKTPLAYAIRRARVGDWQPQAVYNLGHTHLSKAWVSGIPTTINIMLWVSSIGIGWSLWKNRSSTTADRPSWKGS
ncbi:MAG: hypothetical protein H6673_03175 [Anaerolineales bacterium]|nr:hypothetical protein [Anaerolineales bacterium]